MPRAARLPSGLTVKQEHYARLRADGAESADAYRLAYDAENMKVATVTKRASELSARGDIAGHIAKIQARVAILADDSAADVLRDTKATYEAAQDAKQYGPAVAALSLRARRHPEFSDKRELSGPAGGAIPVALQAVFAALTPEQLADVLAQLEQLAKGG